jgi:DNA-binding PadR family transcriptional regulator
MHKTPYLKIRVLGVLKESIVYMTPLEISDALNNSNSHDANIVRVHNIDQQLRQYRTQGLVKAEKYKSIKGRNNYRYIITPKGLLRLSFLMEKKDNPDNPS